MLNALIETVVVLVKIAVIFGAVSLVVAYLTYFERKAIAHMQVRMGPMRVGWHGLLQPIADGIKLIVKEDIIPARSDHLIFRLAPFMLLVPSLIIYAVIPLGERAWVTNINIAVLYVLAVSSLSVYGIVLAGWSSGSKYSLLGGLRSAAQMISYEIFLGFSLIGPLMIAGSLNLVEIVNAQQSVWLVVYQPLAFVLFISAGLAETNRIPFDLPEAETELVAGFHTEYSGMRFGFFTIAEYANLLLLSVMATLVFFGGWHGPLLPGFVWLLLKVAVFIFLFFWLRATLPRFRYDQLMRLGWKIMFPLALLNIAVTGIVYYFVV
ncbi:MAG: NADH-quinone oxidoreductase subunit NuoH [Candidatus Tectomicrobia bacterium]|nr:NADH-quinone oxidoreductase subunit NuoH [Candidatus Tectomicrobia bacterium]